MVSQDWNSLEGLANFVPPPVPNATSGDSSELISIPDGNSTATAILDGQDVPREALIPLLGEESHPGSVWDASDDSLSSESRQDIRRFRGDTAPWNVLVDGTATSIVLANDGFNETIARLAEEDSSTPAVGSVYCDFLKESPPLTKDLVLEYANNYGREVPFPRHTLGRLQTSNRKRTNHQRWSHWGEVVCVLLVSLNRFKSEMRSE